MTSHLLLVDAANVVGSRPDGWWRDRPGAARRLIDQIRAAATPDAASVVVVLEGAARAGWPPGRVMTQGQTLEVVHADGSGDDLLVALTEQATGPVAVVTADRELRARIRSAGGTVRGPRWLLDQLSTLK